MHYSTDTIAAIATGLTRSAIGILRISGDKSLEILNKVFKPTSCTPLLERNSNTLIYGNFYDINGKLLDQCLATFAKAPHSYTGEDTAELQCHGSPAVLLAGMEALIAAGARQAERGEFTKRAFLNAKLDLIQAEAVIDIIDAESTSAAENAVGQLSGAMSRKISDIYNGLVDLMAHFCAVLDYPDEDIDSFQSQEIADYSSKASRDLKLLSDSYKRGRQLISGIPTAIIGAPNAGKSSLLNALLGYERAIVTDIAGTTRDTIEEKAQIGGVLLKLIDTAGIRDTSDVVERIGVERSRKALESADLALAVIDASTCLNNTDKQVLNLVKGADNAIVLLNQSDKENILVTSDDILNIIGSDASIISISCKSKQGLEELESTISSKFGNKDVQQGELLTNERQAEAIRQASEALERVRDGLNIGMSPDALLTDVEDALSYMGEVNGRKVSDDITDRIFERFCVGK